MPGQFNTGHDTSLDVWGPGGAILISQLITDFDYKQDTTDLKSAPLTDALTRHEYIPDGWSGSFTIDRSGRAVDDLIAALERQYYTNQTVTQITITQTIREIDLSISQYRFTRVRVKLDSGGAWKKDGKVEMKLHFSASTRDPI